MYFTYITGVAIQLQNPDDDLSKALVVLGNKGIAYRVISCDQSDSELTLNTTYDVPSRSQSTEYLNISEEIDPNPELSKSLHDLLAKPSKKKVGHDIIVYSKVEDRTIQIHIHVGRHVFWYEDVLFY